MNLTIQQKQENLINDFNSLKNWEDRYHKIIKLGKELEGFNEEWRIEDLKVKGCQSQVWLKAEMQKNGNIIFYGDSDALIVKGLLSILLYVFSDNTPTEILNSSNDFIKHLGFEANLSPSRANGFYSMLKQIKYYATAFSFYK